MSRKSYWLSSFEEILDQHKVELDRPLSSPSPTIWPNAPGNGI